MLDAAKEALSATNRSDDQDEKKKILHAKGLLYDLLYSIAA